MIDRGDSKVRGRRSAGSKHALCLKVRAGQRAEFADDRKMTRYGQPLRLVAAADKIGLDATWFAVHEALSPLSGAGGAPQRTGGSSRSFCARGVSRWAP